MDEHYDKFQQDFIEAIGRDKKFNDTQAKENFAGDIYSTIYWALLAGEDKVIFNKHLTALQKESGAALKALKSLQNKLLEARRSFNSITQLSSFLSISIAHPHTDYDITLDDFIARIAKYEADISCVTRHKSKTGKNNEVSFFVAYNIAFSYHQYLGHKPFASNGDKLACNNSPYDRICDLVEKYWPVDMSIRTKRDAVKKLKESLK